MFVPAYFGLKQRGCWRPSEDQLTKTAHGREHLQERSRPPPPRPSEHHWYGSPLNPAQRHPRFVSFISDVCRSVLPSCSGLAQALTILSLATAPLGESQGFLRAAQRWNLSKASQLCPGSPPGWTRLKHVAREASCLVESNPHQERVQPAANQAHTPTVQLVQPPQIPGGPPTGCLDWLVHQRPSSDGQ